MPKPSAIVLFGFDCKSPDFHDKYAAGAASDWTPITFILGLMAFAAIAVPQTPLPAPTGTIITSALGRSSNISKVYVPTPSIRSGVFAE